MGDADEPRFERVRPVRAYEQVVEQVEDRVLRGSLRPGEHLPSEREMMAQFGVGRSTVREALRVLESGGLVRSRPGDPAGPEVMPFSPDTLRRSLTRLVRVDGIGLGDLVQFRMVLDAWANQLAAQVATAGQLAGLAAALDRMEASVDAGEEDFSRADVAFHDLVAEAGGSVLVQVCGDVVRGVVLGLVEHGIVHAPDRRALMLRSVAHHREVLEAVAARDGDRAAHLARTTLHAYYAGYVPDDERERLDALLGGARLPG